MAERASPPPARGWVVDGEELSPPPLDIGYEANLSIFFLPCRSFSTVLKASKRPQDRLAEFVFLVEAEGCYISHYGRLLRMQRYTFRTSKFRENVAEKRVAGWLACFTSSHPRRPRQCQYSLPTTCRYATAGAWRRGAWRPAECA